MLNIIGLNPSTADAVANDPTIRRCIGFARDNGFGSLIVTNLFAYRATAPKDLFQAKDPIGPDNDHWLSTSAQHADQVLFAWGNHGKDGDRDHEVLALISEGYCLGLTKLGAPRHPLYVRKEQAFIPFPM